MRPFQECKIETRVTYSVTGIVQGVGFRPYVYGLARRCALKGYVLNDAMGVQIVLEGPAEALAIFESRFFEALPPLARIDSCERRESAAEGLREFEIRSSDGDTAGRSTAVSPDMALCDACREEMRDPADRRYGYWLINCTDCGPRYSIVRTVPYDRPNTSMASFAMCDACRSEYEDPTNRRYHAQPLSCPDCGPKSYYREGGRETEGEQSLLSAVEALRAGKIVAVKGLGGFHLMCDATREESVRTLRERKRRPSKPFAVMFPTLESVRECAVLSDAEAEALGSATRPVVLLRSRSSRIAPSVAPGIDRLGAFLPYTPLHERLFDAVGVPLVATSANLSDAPIIRTEAELFEKLSGVFDGVWWHERKIVNACDDSVLQMLDHRPLMLRLARGYAPFTMRLPRPTDRRILAVGANQKNSIAIAFGETLILSPHIGDLGSVEAFGYFERTLETFKRFYDFEPDLIVCDKHPGYETARWARAQDVEVLEVQHQHAHILAAMAEYGMEEEVLGFAFDGTGYGDDGTVWGGEVLRCRGSEMARVASLRPFRLLGGEKAVREPRRSALGMLFECYDLETVLKLELPTVRAFERDEIRMLHAAWERGLNAPVSTSAGRLFDAVASLAGVCQRVSYEGESGLLLEAAAKVPDASGAWPRSEGVIDWSNFVRKLAEYRTTPEAAAGALIGALAETMVVIARSEGLPVVLSGGVFQNRTLLERVIRRLDEEGVRYAIPSRVPVNDGCIALGQIWYALERGKPPCDRSL